MKKAMGIIFGVLLIAVGVFNALETLGVAELNFSIDGWWALFLIVPGVTGIFTSRDKVGNLIVALIGVYLLLAARGVIGYGDFWELLVPAIIVLLGVKIIVSSFSEKKEYKSENGVTECTASFEKKEKTVIGKDIRMARVGAVFGGAKCNLSDADFSKGGEINVLCLFGGADITVPENVDIKVNAFCLFGGISDKRKVSDAAKTESLTVNGFCLFGGADIR